MKRSRKRIILSSDEDEFSNNKGGVNSESDENFGIHSSDDEFLADNSVSSKKNNINGANKRGKTAQKKASDTNSAKKFRSGEKKGKPITKKTKTTNNANRQNDDETVRMGSRHRNKTNRFGNRESTVNFDNFFNILEAQREAGESSKQSSTENELNARSVGPTPERNVDVSSFFSFDDRNATNLMAREQSADVNMQSLSTCANELKLMEAKFDAKMSVIIKQCSRIEALLKFQKLPNESNNTEHLVDENGDACEIRLKQMGLPATTIFELKEIEEKLKDGHFEADMVFIIIFTQLISHYVHF